MEFWLKRGFKLEGTKEAGVYIVTNGVKSGVLTTNFWDELVLSSPWFGSVERARAEVSDVVATV